LRSNEVRPTSEVINTLLRASDCIKSLLDSITTSNERDVSEHIVALENLLLNPANLIDGQLPVASPHYEVLETEHVAGEDIVLTAQVPKLNPELLRDFLIECHENLEQLDAFLVALEHEPNDRELLNSVFRTLHTIEGSSGFLSFRKVEAVAHAAENLLSELRAGQFTACCRWSTYVRFSRPHRMRV